MKITLRLITSLLIVTTFVAGSFSYVQYRAEKNRLVRELERRVVILSDTLKESLESRLESGDRSKISRVLERFTKRENLLGLLIYENDGTVLAQSQAASGEL